MTASEQANILARIGTLERYNRRLRSMMVGLALLLIAGLCLHLLSLGAQADAAERKAKADRLALHDQNGKERIVFNAAEDNPVIQLLNSEGKTVAALGAKRGPYIHFMDSKGVPRLELSAGDDWTRLAFMDEHSAPRLDISASADPLLLLRDEKGHRILEVLKDGPKLTFFDSDGKPLFTKP